MARKSSSSGHWTPTHEALHEDTGERVFVRVKGDGAWTREEWETSSAPSYTKNDQFTWMFRGRIFDGTFVPITKESVGRPSTEPDIESLRKFLENHSVRGYEVKAPIFGPAVIEDQVSAREFTYYKVVPDKPMPFSDFAEAMDVPDDQMTLAEWKEKFIAGSTRTLPSMASDLRERLQAGGTVSRRDVLFRELLDRGCLDTDQNVICHTFDSRDVTLRVLRKGMGVEIDDGENAGWPGRIVGIEGKVVLIEQFVPVPMMRTPHTLVAEKVRPGFYSEEVVMLGPGIMNTFEEHGVKPPPGTWDEEKEEYTLKRPMPVTEIEAFCKKHYDGDDAKYCTLQALTLFIVPVDGEQTKFTPLPEGRDPREYFTEQGA